MEITRKKLVDIVKANNGFIRLDNLVRATGQSVTPESLWVTLDKVTKDVLPALRQDCAEGERDEAVVLVSHRRRGTHGLDDGAFPQEPMPDKPVHLLKKQRKSKKPDAEKSEPNMPGLVLVPAEWFSRGDAEDAFKVELADILSDHEDPRIANATVRFCKAASEGGFLVTLHVPDFSTDE